MNNEIIFYHNPMSRGRIVHWMLEELEEPYEIRLLDFTKKEHKSSSYLAVNPMGKIPAIVHRGTVVTESAAICAYLADAFPKKQFSPGLDSPKRGTYLRWLFFGAGCLEPAIIDKMLSRPAPEKVSANAYGTYDDTIHALEVLLSEGRYVLGDRFSAADVYLASCLGFGFMTKALEPKPLFQKYVSNAIDRPAYKRMMDQCQELEKKLKVTSS